MRLLTARKSLNVKDYSKFSHVLSLYNELGLEEVGKRPRNYVVDLN